MNEAQPMMGETLNTVHISRAWELQIMWGKYA